MNHNLEDVYNEYSETLFKICLRYSSSRAEAEDILHDSFIHIYERLAQYQGKGSFEGWLKRVVVSVALNRMRTNRFTPSHYEAFDEISESKIQDTHSDELPEDREKLLDAGLTHDDVLSCLQELPVKARTIFNLYVFEEKKHKEIAKELDISANTSKTQLKRARLLLKNLLIKHADMKLKNLKKLSIFAVFARSGENTFIDGFVKERINSANVTPPTIDISSVINQANTASVAASGSTGLLSQIASYLKMNAITYSVGTVIATASVVGLVTLNQGDRAVLLEPMSPRLLQQELYEEIPESFEETSDYLIIETKHEQVKEVSQPVAADTITLYEHVRVVDSAQ
ncbi:MAG: sigma-70 family RNA polymerase sigma factor [Salinivirgaceae bacterium]|nr:sigma-70 family RNA polymerase sigma factor [Salinivirgaceae bacterium]